MPIIYLCMVVVYLIYLPRKIDGHTTGSQRVGFNPKDHSLHVTSRCQQINMTPQDPTYANALQECPPSGLIYLCRGSPIPINRRHQGHHQPWLAQRLGRYTSGTSKASSATDHDIFQLHAYRNTAQRAPALITARQHKTTTTQQQKRRSPTSYDTTNTNNSSEIENRHSCSAHLQGNNNKTTTKQQ